MNNAEYYSKRRIADISMNKKHVDEFVENKIWFGNIIPDVSLKEMVEARDRLTIAFLKDIKYKDYSLGHFYETMQEVKENLSCCQQFQLTGKAESIMRYAINLEELESRERAYRNERKYIISAGYLDGDRYKITYPDNPGSIQEEWVITEFTCDHMGNIRPVNGHKIKKNGQPYANAQCVTYNNGFRLIKVE